MVSKVAITGSSGLIGREVVRLLQQAGVEVVRLVRREPREPGEVRWNPEGPSDLSAAGPLDAMVHLAGENIAAGRWTARRRAQLRASRVDATRHLIASLHTLPYLPKVFVTASATGWYRTDTQDPQDESAPPADTFLGRLVRDWEEAACSANALGIRTVAARFGVVLSKEGGMLARLLPIFRLGLGGPVGTGEQILSWVTLSDAAAAIRFVLETPMDGPVNVVAPQPIPQREFATALARVLHRPAWIRTPAWALRILFGEMADALLLSGARVIPTRLQAAGFEFQHPTLEQALRAILP